MMAVWASWRNSKWGNRLPSNNHESKKQLWTQSTDTHVQLKQFTSSKSSENDSDETDRLTSLASDWYQSKIYKKTKKKTVIVEHEQNVRLKEIKWVFTPNISYYLQHTHKESKAKQCFMLI